MLLTHSCVRFGFLFLKTKFIYILLTTNYLNNNYGKLYS